MNEFWKGIEEPIRDAVRLLRDNGFNTTCSCGHKMYIEVDLMNLDDIETIATLLLENNYKSFKIITTLYAPSDAFWSRRATIHFNGWM